MRLADFDQHAVRHEGEIQRSHRIFGLDRLAIELAGEPLGCCYEHFTHRLELDAGIKAIGLRQRCMVAPVDEHDAVSIERPERT